MRAGFGGPDNGMGDKEGQNANDVFSQCQMMVVLTS